MKKKIKRLNSLYGFASNVPFVLLFTFQPHLPELVDGLFLIAVAIQGLLVKPLRFPNRGRTLPFSLSLAGALPPVGFAPRKGEQQIHCSQFS